jgi:hypothetical protein
VASVALPRSVLVPPVRAGEDQAVLESDWGRLFANWGKVAADPEGRGFPEVGAASPELTRIGLDHFREGLRLVGMAVAESPEVLQRIRRATARS